METFGTDGGCQRGNINWHRFGVISSALIGHVIFGIFAGFAQRVGLSSASGVIKSKTTSRYVLRKSVALVGRRPLKLSVKRPV